MRPIKRIIIHCTASKEGKEVTEAEINKMHKKRGFRKTGYHKIFHLDGTVSVGREINEIGAHCKGFNYDSIGYSYVGGLDKNGKPKDTRTEEQQKAIETEIKKDCETYPIQEIKGHRDYSADLNGDGVISKNEWMKSCPCYDAEDEYKKYTL